MLNLTISTASGGGYVQEPGGYVQEPGGYVQEPFHQAHARAQEPTAAAESDPSDDVYGVNVCYSLQVLILHDCASNIKVYYCSLSQTNDSPPNKL